MNVKLPNPELKNFLRYVRNKVGYGLPVSDHRFLEELISFVRKYDFIKDLDCIHSICKVKNEEVFSIQDFKEAVNNGLFNDYDGVGFLSEYNDSYSDIAIQPSEVFYLQFPNCAKYIIWTAK